MFHLIKTGLLNIIKNVTSVQPILNKQMELFMKTSSKMVYLKEKEFLGIQMEMFMKAILKKVKEKEKEFLKKQMELLQRRLKK